MQTQHYLLRPPCRLSFTCLTITYCTQTHPYLLSALLAETTMQTQHPRPSHLALGDTPNQLCRPDSTTLALPHTRLGIRVITVLWLPRGTLPRSDHSQMSDLGYWNSQDSRSDHSQMSDLGYRGTQVLRSDYSQMSDLGYWDIPDPEIRRILLYYA